MDLRILTGAFQRISFVSRPPPDTGDTLTKTQNPDQRHLTTPHQFRLKSICFKMEDMHC